jgi:hypothetical protein
MQVEEIVKEDTLDVMDDEKGGESGDGCNTLTKYELKRLEAEKRVKRINELMELIQKINEEIHLKNEEVKVHQTELQELLKVQIALPPMRQKREKRVKEVDSQEEEGTASGTRRREKVEKEKEEEPKKQLGTFSKFFFTPPPPPPPIEVLPTPSPSPSPFSPGGSGSGKRRARAVSYDEVDKKVRLENFEITDIFQLKNIDVDFVRECLEKCDVTGDIKLFRRIFTKGIPKDQQLLRYLGGKNYQTKRNGLWIDDMNAGYIKHVLMKIFEQSYMYANDFEHYGENIDRFLMNQEHINSFNDDKYIEKLMAQITNIVDIKVGDK